MIQATLRPTRKKASYLHDAFSSGQIWKSSDQTVEAERMDANVASGCSQHKSEDPFVRNPGWRDVQLNRITLAIASTGRLCDDWNGYGAERPSASTREVMWRVLDLSKEQGLIPDRVVPSAAGGLFMLFKGNTPSGTPLKADVESFNSGEVTFAYKPKDGELVVWEASANDTEAIKESIKQIRAIFA